MTAKGGNCCMRRVSTKSLRLLKKARENPGDAFRLRVGLNDVCGRERTDAAGKARWLAASLRRQDDEWLDEQRPHSATYSGRKWHAQSAQGRALHARSHAAMG